MVLTTSQLAVYFWDLAESRQTTVSDKSVLPAFKQFNQTFTHSLA
jgi:hypothetical protein